MPLYEYACAQCGARFTLLQPMTVARDGHACPECGSLCTRRVMSSFATSGADTSAAGCGPGGSGFR
ncbi:MAG: zinc ribbon domain-containing protein [Chthonomonadales bacterium]|nr:zinc ribbon domain-containing protein [Chthonomonadales bacterium]